MDADSLERLTAAVESVQGRLLTPALVFDLDAVRHNARAMLARVGQPERWRPHIKTVKASAILRILLEEGVRHFKCATVSELDLLLRTAASSRMAVDVLLAYPLTRAAASVVFDLGRQHPHSMVRVLADDPAHLLDLDQWLSRNDGPSALSVMLDVDLGMARTGCSPRVWHDALPQLQPSKGLHLAGLHGYDGHWRWDQRPEAHTAYDALCDLADAVHERTEVVQVVTSGTHSYEHALTHARLSTGPWLAQVSPGTLVLSDLRTRDPGRALGLRQGVYVGSRAISVAGPGRVTLDAGSKALAPDIPPPNARVLGHADWIPQRPSEEHLPVSIPDGATPRRDSIFWLIPAHACTTVNLHARALLLAGDRIIGDCEIEAQGHTLWGRSGGTT